MMPLPEIVPVVIIPVKTPVNAGLTQRLCRFPCNDFIGQKKRQKRCRVAFGVGKGSENDLRKRRQGILNGVFMGPLFFQDNIEFSQLRQADGGIQFTDAKVCSQDRMVFETPITADVVMAVI